MTSLATTGFSRKTAELSLIVTEVVFGKVSSDVVLWIGSSRSFSVKRSIGCEKDLDVLRIKTE